MHLKKKKEALHDIKQHWHHLDSTWTIQMSTLQCLDVLGGCAWPKWRVHPKASIHLTVAVVEEAHAVRQGAPQNRHQHDRMITCKFCDKEHEMNKQKCPAFGKKRKKCGKAKHFANVEPRWDKHPKVTWLTVSVTGSGSESAVGIAEVVSSGTGVVLISKADMGIHGKPAPTHVRMTKLPRGPSTGRCARCKKSLIWPWGRDLWTFHRQLVNPYLVYSYWGFCVLSLVACSNPQRWCMMQNER